MKSLQKQCIAAPSHRFLWALIAVSAALLTAYGCGKRTEVEKTTVIEKTVTQEPEATSEVGHMERAGEKIDQKVNRKIDRAIDSMLK